MNLLLVYLLVGAQGYFRYRDGRCGHFRLPEGPEVCVDKMAVSFDIGERLPDDVSLGEEALVRHEQEELLL